MLDADGHYFALLLPLLAACASPTRDGAGAAPASRPQQTETEASAPALPAEARAVIEFWRGAGPSLWFAQDPEFDRRFRERFADAHAAAARGELSRWGQRADGALALILLLDQYPRNAFRGTPRMYATDALARAEAERAVAAGFDRTVAPELQAFVLLPFGHSESLADQERSVALCRRLGSPNLEHAEHHRDIVRRFGRFPHRNAILGRASTDAERAYLANGGYQG
ncbi:MAG TPA: DUF924 family protein [Polyangiaceae bacterium]|nr:DUF924 family protein [Polyangiaceae bacterium]